MTVAITIQVPDTLGQQLQRFQDRLPEVLEPGLREVMADRADAFADERAVLALLASQPAPEQVTVECEHIVAEKHGGAPAADKLARACPFCNRFKGTDLGSLDPDTGQLTSFFHPRTHQWGDHFRLEGAWIVPLTPEGRVTVFIFQLNYGIKVDGEWGGQGKIKVKDGQFSYEAADDLSDAQAVFHYKHPSDMVLTTYQRIQGGEATGDPQVIDKVNHLFFHI